MTQNATNKKLIEYLTKTHQKPATAYKQAIAEATDEPAKDYLRRVAEALGVDLTK